MAANLAAAREAAESFRAQHIAGKPFEDRFPIDVVFIADVGLGLNLIDFPGLEDEIGSSAYVTGSLTELYIDEELQSAYNSPSAPVWKKDRLRFSVAHELGHIQMHGTLVPKIRCAAIEDLKARINTPPAWVRDVEDEASEFAGALIAPRSHLEQAFKAFGELQAQTNPKWRDYSELRDRFCAGFGAKVGLHIDGVRTRLNREELWPREWTIGG